jgi:ribosomal 50S subunit-recycling heat shock protein
VRLDLFLKLAGTAKTRSLAARLITSGQLSLLSPSSGARLKPSHEVSVGERYRVERLAGYDLLEVLAIPAGRSLAKKDRSEYIKVEKSVDGA